MNKNNSILGELGEKLVVESEKQKLIDAGKPNLAKKIRKESDFNDSAGYDIISYDEDENELLIEVKTTTGGHKTPFYISSNEIKASEENSENYYIYRLFDFDEERNSSNYYEIQGSVSEHCILEPINFKALPNENN